MTAQLEPIPLYRFLDDVGDGSGNPSGSVDASGPGGIYLKLVPPPGIIYTVHRMIVEMRFTGGGQAQDYGAINGGLTNGIRVLVRKAGATYVDLVDRQTIKTNAGWGYVCYDVTLNTWGAGDSMLAVRWTFAKAGQPIILRGDEEADLVVHLQDDLRTLINHGFMAQGNSSGARQ